MQIAYRLFLVILPLTLHINPASAGIRDVGNGGGAAEQVLLYTWSQMPELLEPALQSRRCTKNPGVQSLLKKLVTSHSQELKEGGILFPIEWSHEIDQIYETKPHLGEKIEFNSIALYQLTTNSDQVLGVSEALGLLITALSEHHSEFSKDAENLARTCAQDFWQSAVSDSNFKDIAHSEISLLTISSTSHPFGQEILMGFGDGYTDVSKSVAQNLICEQATLTGFKISALYWDLKNLRIQENQVAFTARGEIRYRCSGSVENLVVGNIALHFSASVINGTPEQFIQAPEKYVVINSQPQPVVELTDLH